jgi:fructose-bisphosphate aldolase, class I
MASATIFKSSFLPKKAEWFGARQAASRQVISVTVRASAYSDELVKTAVSQYI